MSDRITVSLPRSLVDAIDRYATEAGVSRSSVIREASADYLTRAGSRQAAERRKRAVEGFLAFLDETSNLPVIDDRPVLEILRELRGPLGPTAEESEGDRSSGL